MNLVILTGFLGKDPEVKYTASGMAVAHFTLATTEYSKGEKKTSWHRIVVFDKQAENCQKYLAKGSKALIDGRIQYGEYEKDGQKVKTVEIIANRVEFLNSKSEGDRQGQDTHGTYAEPPQGQQRPGQHPPVGGTMADDGDIPF